MMTADELSVLKEIEKDFDKDTALRIYNAGYRKVVERLTCQRCGREFFGKGKIDIAYFDEEGIVRNAHVTLCDRCYGSLCKSRNKADDKFFSELKPYGE